MKKLTAVILILAMLFALPGCASMLYKEYYDISDYSEETTDFPEDTTGSIKSYTGLLRAINRLVRNHETDGRLTFSNYEGDISADLANACWEVKSETALGAFAVDYMSYDLSRIVSYYEADIYITYKRAKTQTDSIVPLSSPSYVRGKVQTAVEEGQSGLLLSLTTMLIDEAAIVSYADETYLENPLMVIVRPKVSVHIYPDSGSEKIFEIGFDYGFEQEELEAMRTELSDAVSALFERLRSDDDEAEMLRHACSYIAGSTLYDPTGSARQSSVGYDDFLGSTAYGALVDAMADSQGFAMAIKLLCSIRGLDCAVVSGRLGQEEHWWNIISLGGEYYHLDLSQWKTAGAGAVYMKSDSDMRNADYWWDNNEYPVSERALEAYSPTDLPDPQGTQPPDVVTGEAENEAGNEENNT